jgi:hypothetical protein
MSAQEVKLVLNQLLNDEAFAEIFRMDPHSALMPFNLTDEERASLQALDLSEVEESDIRVSHEMDMSAIRVGAMYLS